MIFDIAFNISDPAYKGIYYDKIKHEPDIEIVLSRAKSLEIIPFFIGSDYDSSIECLENAKKYNTFCYVGIHPNSATKNKNDIEAVKKIINESLIDKNFHTKYLSNEIPNNEENIKFYDKNITNNIIAVGECGLDYYRKTSTPSDQKFIFKELLDLNYKNYFLHNRNSFRDFVEILSDYKVNGVVHSFDGKIEEAQELIKMGYYIGINGCSLKTEENIEVVKNIDIDKMLLETDSPYCRIAKSYSVFNYLDQNEIFETNTKKKYVQDKVWKARNEPATINEILNVVSKIKNLDKKTVEFKVKENTINVFGEEIRHTSA